ncbi:putative C6 zinc finger domain protein [Neofusicoccum parvum]|uniref:C6 zinc finger domain protein n=1 Tax=Neofusicoccum parvum TaxID=310453 RepID=A0ACB5S1Z9_9PEZI|nr:putative C6 zinc finger domain protein [Neofusicoccum parvum]
MYALIDSNNNTYDNVIVPLTQHSPLLLRAVLALSANHLKPRNPNYLTVALDHRGSVLAALFHALNHQPHSLSKTEIVASVLMLCFCDLPDDRQGDWRKHFYGVRQLINLPSQQLFTSTDNALLSYLGQYFAPRVILAYSALDNPANEAKMVEAASFWLTKIDRPEREINCVSGCSTELVRVIFDIVQQVRRWLRYPDQRTEIRAWKEATEHTLRTIRQLVPATTTSASNTANATADEERQSAERAKRAEQMAETYRLAAVILLQYLEDDVWQRSSTVKACVRSILDLMEVIDKPGEHAKTCSIWPWFIASCHASSDAERLHVLRKYAFLVDEDWYGNTLPVAQVLAEKTWLKHDMDGYCGAAGARGRPGSGFFPWEEALMGLGMDFTWS